MEAIAKRGLFLEFVWLMRGARKPKGEILKVVWPGFLL